MHERATTDLAINALVMAIGRRQPDRDVVHHSDRGSVYTSLRFANHLEDCGLVASFGSTGDADDNAAMEAFWATLKRELAWIHHRHRWMSRAELRATLFDYIEAFYNRSRHQAGLPRPRGREGGPSRAPRHAGGARGSRSGAQGEGLCRPRDPAHVQAEGTNGSRQSDAFPFAPVRVGGELSTSAKRFH
jgi:hypothetical protein